MQSNRNKKRGQTVTATPESVTVLPGKHSNERTVTDQAFIDDFNKRYDGDPPAGQSGEDWYRFDKEVFGRDCWDCKKAFRTQLKLNRFCSPKCRDNNIRRKS